ncbi:Crp/Fnr family transcriptional regulator [Streptomyces sp. NPDC006140]|uniref:Crp/Fnr family transcriptional regulator n=1 Tax=Streptomyces sp. NPDC006140 TaxID=3154579 RepID=UPI0033CC1D32
MSSLQQHGWPPGTFLGGLSPNAHNALIAQGRRRSFKSGERLLVQGDRSDHVFVLMNGVAKVTAYTPDGHEILLRIARPGSAVGATSMLDHQPRSATVTTLGPCTTLILPGPSFADYLDRHPEALRALTREVIGKLRASDSIRLDLSSGSLVQRLARLLTTLATDYGHPTENGLTISLRLSQEELASLIGASRESLARGLRLLRNKEIITTHYRNITIHDMPVLNHLANDQV